MNLFSFCGLGYKKTIFTDFTSCDYEYQLFKSTVGDEGVGNSGIRGPE